MNLVKMLVKYMEKKRITVAEVASQMEMEEQDLRRMLYWEEDIYLSDLETIMEIVGVTFEELISDKALVIDFAEAPSDNVFNALYNSLNEEDRQAVKQLVDMIESMDGMISVSKKSDYMN